MGSYLLARAGHQIGRLGSRGRATYRFPIWFTSAGIFIPKAMAVYIGGLMFSPGRLAITVLFFPALLGFFRGLSRGLYSISGADVFMLALSAWMMAAPWFSDNSGSSPLLAGSEVLELFGAFLIGRTYIHGRPALEYFMQTLAVIACVVTLIGITDIIAGHYFVYDTTARWFGQPFYGAVERSGMLRAESTFDHPILFGAFGVICATLFLHHKMNRRRFLYVSVGICAGLLSISAGPLLAFSLMVAAYLYGKVMSNFAWRWKALWGAFGLFLCVLFSVSNSPIGWICDHLTFDAESAYFRLATWYAAFDRISESPWVGFFREKSGNEFLDRSIDSVWLVCALLYGLPMVALLILANLASFLRTKPITQPLTEDEVFTIWMRRGLTATLGMFIFIGLTVHYWNAMWMFWGLCIGIRTSLRQPYFVRFYAPTYPPASNLTSTDERLTRIA
jgi:hypothetical protein